MIAVFSARGPLDRAFREVFLEHGFGEAPPQAWLRVQRLSLDSEATLGRFERAVLTIYFKVDARKVAVLAFHSIEPDVIAQPPFLSSRREDPRISQRVPKLSELLSSPSPGHVPCNQARHRLQKLSKILPTSHPRLDVEVVSHVGMRLNSNPELQSLRSERLFNKSEVASRP